MYKFCFWLCVVGREELVRAIIQPDANHDSPPRIWCPGAAQCDMVANSVLFDLEYRRTWTRGVSIVLW